MVLPINNRKPKLENIEPSSKPAGSGDFPLTVNGANFVSGSIVRIDGADRTTTFVNDKQLTAQILAGDIESTGTARITGFNPPPGGGTSRRRALRITGP